MKVNYKGDIVEAILLSKSSVPGSLHPHMNSADIKVETDARTKLEQHTTGVA